MRGAVSDKTDSFLYPDFWRTGRVISLRDIFDEIVLTEEVRAAGGHWLAGVNEFVHNPNLTMSAPNFLPVLDGQVWGVDFDAAGADPYKIDSGLKRRVAAALKRRRRMSVMERRDAVLKGELTPEGFVGPAAMGRILARASPYLRPDAGDAPPPEDAAPATGPFSWDTAAPGRDRNCPYTGMLDPLGYEILRRVESIFNGLRFSHKTRSCCLAYALPPGPEPVAVEIEPDRWSGHIKVDFDRSVFFEATYDPDRPWLPIFKDINISHRDEMDREAAPYVRAEITAKKAATPEDSDPQEAIGVLSSEQQSRLRSGSSKERVYAAVDIIRETGRKPVDLANDAWKLLGRPDSPTLATVQTYLKRFNLTV